MKEKCYAVRILKEGDIPVLDKKGPIKQILLTESWIRLLARFGIPMMILHTDNDDPFVTEINNTINNSMALSNPNNVVRYDTVQNLKETEKATVRNNISAISMNDLINYITTLNLDKYVDNNELTSEITQVESRCNLYTDTKTTQIVNNFNNSFATKQYVDTKVSENNSSLLTSANNYANSQVSQLDTLILNRHYTKEQENNIHQSLEQSIFDTNLNLNTRITTEVTGISNELVKRVLKSNNLSDLSDVNAARDNINAFFKYAIALRGNTAFWSLLSTNSLPPGFYFCNENNSIDLPITNIPWFILVTDVQSLSMRVAILFSFKTNINAIYYGYYNYGTNILSKNNVIYHSELAGVFNLVRSQVLTIPYPNWFVRVNNTFNFKIHIFMPASGSTTTITPSTIMNDYLKPANSTIINNISFNQANFSITAGTGISSGILYPIIIYYQRLGVI